MPHDVDLPSPQLRTRYQYCFSQKHCVSQQRPPSDVLLHRRKSPSNRRPGAGDVTSTHDHVARITWAPLKVDRRNLYERWAFDVPRYNLDGQWYPPGTLSLHPYE
eukprot:3586333-Rhodomonas_salina.2